MIDLFAITCLRRLCLNDLCLDINSVVVAAVHSQNWGRSRGSMHQWFLRAGCSSSGRTSLVCNLQLNFMAFVVTKSNFLCLSCMIDIFGIGVFCCWVGVRCSLMMIVNVVAGFWVTFSWEFTTQFLIMEILASDLPKQPKDEPLCIDVCSHCLRQR